MSQLKKINNKHRLYIDEVGHHGKFKNENDIGQRYLSLTGIILDLNYVKETVSPLVESIKKEFFNPHPDEPLIFHRKDIINKNPPFHVLKDNKIENEFNSYILKLFKELNYTVITVVLDKKEFMDQYLVWRHHPYHYCLEIIVERFVLFLEKNNLVGDIMCESRGGKEDKKLKQSFNRLWNRGTDFISQVRLQQHLTSSQLKVKPKFMNISGLQLADLLAYPSFKSMLIEKNKIEKRQYTFGEKIIDILEDGKYYCRPKGKSWGFGKKWLP